MRKADRPVQPNPECKTCGGRGIRIISGKQHPLEVNGELDTEFTMRIEGRFSPPIALQICDCLRVRVVI